MLSVFVFIKTLLFGRIALLDINFLHDSFSLPTIDLLSPFFIRRIYLFISSCMVNNYNHNSLISDKLLLSCCLQSFLALNHLIAMCLNVHLLSVFFESWVALLGCEDQ